MLPPSFLFGLITRRVFRPDIVAGGCPRKHTSFGAVGGMPHASYLGREAGLMWIISVGIVVFLCLRLLIFHLQITIIDI